MGSNVENYLEALNALVDPGNSDYNQKNSDLLANLLSSFDALSDESRALRGSLLLVVLHTFLVNRKWVEHADFDLVVLLIQASSSVISPEKWNSVAPLRKDFNRISLFLHRSLPWTDSEGLPVSLPGLPAGVPRKRIRIGPNLDSSHARRITRSI